MSNRYPRIASDPSQIEMFKNDFIDGKVLLQAFSPSEVEAGKPYVLAVVNGIISFAPDGWTPAPEDPEIEGKTMLLSKYDDVDDEEHAIIASDKITIDEEEHAMILS